MKEIVFVESLFKALKKKWILRDKYSDENSNIAGKLYKKKIYNVCMKNYTSQKNEYSK